MTAIHIKTVGLLAGFQGRNYDRDSHDPMNLVLKVVYSCA